MTILVVVIALILLIFLIRSSEARTFLFELGGRIQTLGPWGPAAFGLGFIIAGLLLVPASWMTMIAGALFGVGLGFIVSSLAAAIAAGLAFLISRYLLRERLRVRLQERPHFRALDHTVASNGWKILALMRLSPAIPYGLENYAFGLTGMTFRTYLLTTWVAMVPTSLVYATVGWAGNEGISLATGEARQRDPWEWVLLGLGVLATVVVTVYVILLTKRALADPQQATPNGET